MEVFSRISWKRFTTSVYVNVTPFQNFTWGYGYNNSHFYLSRINTSPMSIDTQYYLYIAYRVSHSPKIFFSHVAIIKCGICLKQNLLFDVRLEHSEGQMARNYKLREESKYVRIYESKLSCLILFKERVVGLDYDVVIWHLVRTGKIQLGHENVMASYYVHWSMIMNVHWNMILRATFGYLRLLITRSNFIMDKNSACLIFW